MIVITGAAGFIGSCLVARLNEEKIYDLMLVDDFSHEKKKKNYEGKRFLNTIERNEFLEWWDLQHDSVDFVFHLGARTDTTEPNLNLLNDLNLHYSQQIWNRCAKYNTPLIYASSAATYGAGELGYDDYEKLVDQLKPLNPYGTSKNEFDKWVLRQAQHDMLRQAQQDMLRQTQHDKVQQAQDDALRQAQIDSQSREDTVSLSLSKASNNKNEAPPFWCGLKFFNVFGPNEYHKARMASVIFNGYNQIKQTGALKLFRSHKTEYKDGEQLRDFIYVKDVVEVMLWFMKEQKHSGIYNLGTGKARSFYDLATSTFIAMNLEPKIEFIDIPEDIRNWYQYFTEAKMEKLRFIGYKKDFYSLEDGVKDYVQNYLAVNKIW